MWSSNRAPRRWALVGMFTIGLSGCFQPLYGGAAGGTDVAAELSAISLAPISERVGYYLTNELTFAFTGGGEKPPTKYRLTVTVHERVTTPLIDTVSGRASSGTLGIDADFKLVSSINSEVVASGTAFTTESYDRSSQRFANIRAARDAEIRGAKVIADQIKTRIAAAIKMRG
jgi:LPS-assembly lipoprotein